VINFSKEILYQHSRDLVSTSNQVITRPRVTLANRNKDLVNETANIAGYSRKYLANMRGYLEHFRSLFRLMSPENILKKGFSIVYHKGKIISDPGKIQVGDDISVMFTKTELVSNVKEKKKRNGREFNL
jgi:exodeoxyribonuclease VII large subunit